MPRVPSSPPMLSPAAVTPHRCGPPSTPTRKPPAHTSLSRVCSPGNPTSGACHFRDGHSHLLRVFTWAPSPSHRGPHSPHRCLLFTLHRSVHVPPSGREVTTHQKPRSLTSERLFYFAWRLCLVRRYGLSSWQRPWHSVNIRWITRCNTSSKHHIKTNVSWNANLQSQHSRISFACACPEQAVIRANGEPDRTTNARLRRLWPELVAPSTLLLLRTWPHMCSALLFARSYQRSLRFVSCPKPSQTRNGGTLTKKELLSRGRSVEKVRQIGTTEETFQTFHSPPSSNSYLASPKALKMFSEQLYSIHLGWVVQSQSLKEIDPKRGMKRIGISWEDME